MERKPRSQLLFLISGGRFHSTKAEYSVQTVYNLLNASAGADVAPGYDMPDYNRLIYQANAAEMGVIVIRVLASRFRSAYGWVLVSYC